MNRINMIQRYSQYNYNTINLNQNNNQFNNNNQNNFLNSSVIMNSNYTNPLNNYFYSNNNTSTSSTPSTTRGLNRQWSTTNLLEPKDVYPYILGEKKLIIFERNDKKQFRVKVPLSLRNNELYFTSIEFKINRYSEMDLFYKNKILKNDDSPISIISNGDKVIMAENLEELNFSYYRNQYIPKLRADDIINIVFKFSFSFKVRTMTFSKKTKIRDMFKMFFQENKIVENGKKYYKFLLDSNTLNINDDSPIGKIFNTNGKTIIVDKIKEVKIIKGKELKVTVKNKRKKITETTIGTLNQIKDLYLRLEQDMTNGKIIQRMSQRGKEIRRDDERTFSSIGIRDDFTCVIHFVGDYDDDIEREENIDRHCIIF